MRRGRMPHFGLRTIEASYQAHFAPMQRQRHIRSFVLRAGRMTPAQERALVELWPSYGVELGDASRSVSESAK
jgi:hypothetical protein